MSMSEAKRLLLEGLLAKKRLRDEQEEAVQKLVQVMSVYKRSADGMPKASEHRRCVLRWFLQLSVDERVAALTLEDDQPWISVLLDMSRMLQQRPLARASSVRSARAGSVSPERPQPTRLAGCFFVDTANSAENGSKPHIVFRQER